VVEVVVQEDGLRLTMAVALAVWALVLAWAVEYHPSHALVQPRAVATSLEEEEEEEAVVVVVHLEQGLTLALLPTDSQSRFQTHPLARIVSQTSPDARTLVQAAVVAAVAVEAAAVVVEEAAHSRLQTVAVVAWLVGTDPTVSPTKVPSSEHLLATAPIHSRAVAAVADLQMVPTRLRAAVVEAPRAVPRISVAVEVEVEARVQFPISVEVEPPARANRLLPTAHREVGVPALGPPVVVHRPLAQEAAGRCRTGQRQHQSQRVVRCRRGRHHSSSRVGATCPTGRSSEMRTNVMM
jgi:hypothetical protein